MKTKKKTIKKTKTNLKLIITAPHWFCLNQDENLIIMIYLQEWEGQH